MMESGTKARYLSMIRNVKMMRYLSDDELMALLTQSEIVQFRKGDRIIVEGDNSEYLYAVLEGSVYVSMSSDAEEVFIREMGAFEVFGEAAIFSTEKRTAHVTSSGNTVVLRIHRADILSFFKAHQNGGIKILMFIISGLLKKLKQTNQEMIMDRESEEVGLDDIDTLLEDIMDGQGKPEN